MIQGFKLTLDVAGLLPGVGIVPDVMSAMISAGQGNFGEALFRLGAAIPFWGDGARAGKMLAKGVENSHEVLSMSTALAKNGEKAKNMLKAGDEAGEAFEKNLNELADILGTDAPKGGIDFMDIGRHGGDVYGAEGLGKLGRYLDRRGVKLVLDDPTMLRMKKAGFASDGSKLYLPRDATRYEVMHELGHYAQFRQIGKEAYQALPRPTGPEQAVYDLLRGNERRWYERMNLMERLDAQLKIERDGGVAW